MEVPEPDIALVEVTLALLGLAFTSAVDAAFSVLSKHRLQTILQSQGLLTQRTINYLLDQPYRLKTAFLLLHSGLITLAVSLSLWSSLVYGSMVVTLLLVGLLLVLILFGELIPRSIAAHYPTTTAALFAGPLAALSLLLMPLIFLLNLPLRLIRRSEPTPTIISDEELRLLVSAGEEEGSQEQQDKLALIEGVIDFGDTILREMMVPRVDIVAINHDARLEQALDLVSASGHSRIPVYDDTIDHVVGILYTKDLIPALRRGSLEMPISTLFRPVHFVPETMKVKALLEDLQRRKVHIAIIVDEYGGTAGLATIEDLIEEIVGEIQDEHDIEGPSVQELEEGTYIVDARMLIHDLNNLLDISLPSGNAERIGGLIYEHLGHVPRVGDTINLDGVQATVLVVKGVRATKIRMVCQPPVTSNPDHHEVETSDPNESA